MEPLGDRDLAVPDDGVSVGHRLEPYEWSNEQIAAYEAAIEAVNGVVGAYSAVIDAQEARNSRS